MQESKVYKLTATNPKNSVWVSASAGTGKTTILVERILRLLLNKVPITKILCITYTKVAASEMVNRLMDVLASWSIIKQEELVKKLENLMGKAPSEEEIDLARSLLHEVLEVKEHIKINTIHSFCQFVLNNFPIEAGVSYNFSVIEEDEDAKLKKQSIHYTLDKLIKLDSVLKKFEFSQELELLVYKINEKTLFSSMFNALNNSALINKLQNTDNLKQEIFNSYDVKINADVEAIKLNYLQELKNTLPLTLQILSENNYKIPRSKTSFEEIKAYLLMFLQFTTNEQLYNFDEFIKNYKMLFLTAKGTQRVGLEKLGDTILNISLKVINEINFKLEKINNIEAANLDYAFNIMVLEIYKKYNELKQESSLLNYNDLLLKTLQLLQKENISSWFLYKLDSQIEHLLVDEAQDTSELQWEIIKLISLEFFAGDTAKKDRTIFIVGDVKQSIYSFQGADPNIFFNIFENFNSKLKNINKELHQINTNTSYRSSGAIIEGVNVVSNHIFNKDLPYYKDQELTHISNTPDDLGVFEALPQVLDVNEVKKSCYKYMALTIVNKIVDLHKNFGVNYNDIAILYKKRNNNKILNPLIKLCKDNNIPIALDKIQLSGNIFMQDMISLAQFLLQQNDNFALSCLLKSPFFNLDDNALIEIRYTDINSSMFVNLQSLSKYKTQSDTLNAWIELAKTSSVFNLFSNILYTQKHINAFKVRLNKQVEDLAIEFLNLVLNFSNKQIATLQNLLKHLQDSDIAIKIDNSSNNYVNLLTVHASKGAQFKAVFVLDDIDSNKLVKSNELYTYNSLQNTLEFFVLNQIKSNQTNIFKEMVASKKEKEIEENKRLLYVAITRAKNFVFFCPYMSKLPKKNLDYPKNSWTNLVLNALTKSNLFNSQPFILNNTIFDELKVNKSDIKNLLDAFNLDDVEFYLAGIINENMPDILQPKSFLIKQNLNKAKQENSNHLKLKFNPEDFIKNNPWVKDIANKEEDFLIPLNPSKLSWQEKNPLPSPFLLPFATEDESVSIEANNLQSGIVLHKILEHIESATNKELYINTVLNSFDLSVKIKNEIKKSVLLLINNEKFKNIFDVKNTALGDVRQVFNEISIAGIVKDNNEEKVINARLDKLIIGSNEVIIVDYKMAFGNSKNYALYTPQLLAYKNLLSQIYPTHTILAYAIFTQNLAIKEY
jgi:ATP-dependent helicase/nuclease subunit A